MTDGDRDICFWGFLAVFVGGGGVFDCRLSGVHMLTALYICIYTCLGVILDTCTL